MKKRLYLILADENLFHPFLLLGVISQLRKSSYEIVGVTITIERYKKGILAFIKMQFALWGIQGFLTLGVLNYWQFFLDKIGYNKRLTLRSICARYNIPIIEVEKVNSQDHLSYLQAKKIDIIISSCGQIFKKNLLELPRIACINRHTALLPKYGGVLPVFRAMEQGEKEFGVSVHYMKEKVDEGNILYQKKIVLKKNVSLFKNYIFGFYESIDVIIKSLHNLKEKKVAKKFNLKEKSYYTFPTSNELNIFRKNHITFELSDIWYLQYVRNNELHLAGYYDKLS